MLDMPSPKIAPGVVLDDRWAGTLVDRMVDSVRQGNQRQLALLDQALVSGHSQWGSPVAQRRLLERITRAAADAHLQGLIKPGKRARFSIFHDVWTPDPHRGSLHAQRTAIRCEGAGHPVMATDSPILALTRHALVRLVQRANCRDVRDLIAVMKANWPFLALACGLAKGNPDTKAHRLPPKGEGGWAIPLVVPDTGGSQQAGTKFAVAVLVSNKPYAKDGRDVEVPYALATILEPHMLPGCAQTPFADLCKDWVQLMDGGGRRLFAQLNDDDRIENQRGRFARSLLKGQSTMSQR